jgi:hypothetical protein
MVLQVSRDSKHYKKSINFWPPTANENRLFLTGFSVKNNIIFAGFLAVDNNIVFDNISLGRQN